MPGEPGIEQNLHLGTSPLLLARSYSGAPTASAVSLTNAREAISTARKGRSGAGVLTLKYLYIPVWLETTHLTRFCWTLSPPRWITSASLQNHISQPPLPTRRLHSSP